MSKSVSASKPEVLAIPEPAFTKSWHPIAHRRLVEAIDRNLEGLGIGVRHENFTLTREGKNLFGSYVLDITQDGMRYVLGFRNALDKRFAVGICSGTSVIVCSNLMFNGNDFNAFHKHTNGLTDDRLNSLVEGAVDGSVIEMEKVAQWHKGLKDIWVPKSDFKQFSFDLLQKGVVSPSNFNKYLAAVEEEIRDNDSARDDVNLLDRDGVRLFDAHGGVTRLARTWGQERIINATTKLNGITDDYALALAA